MAWTAPRCWVTGEVVTATLLNQQIKGNLLSTSAGVVTTAGDITYASAANTMARVGKGTNGNILHQASCAPAWTACPSIAGITLSGALDANGTVDADVTDFDVLSSGDIDLVSSANAAAAVYIAQSTGTSGTIKIHADTGTSVTEGAESVNILSDVGGVGIRSTANLANAVNITNDGGTTGTITIFQDQGTSVTEGAASIELLSDAGGVELRSTANLANAIALTSDGGTTGSILIFNDQGTTATEGSSSIQLLSDVGAVGIKSGLNAAGAIRLTADAGTSETIILHADQGSGAASICLTSDAGGITMTASSAVTVTAPLTVGVDDTGHDVKFFGAAAGAYLEWDESANMLEVRGATAAGPGHLKLTTGEATVVACDVLGKIEFQAPAECGTDAITVAARIEAKAQGTFSATVNSTDLIFYTGHSEAATEKVRITSQGEIGIGGANYGTDGQVLTSAGAGAAVAWEDAAGGVGSGPLRIADGSAGAPAYSFTCDTDTGFFSATANNVDLSLGGTASHRFGGSTHFIGDTTAGADVCAGIVLNQGAADNQILAFKSSDVAHGMTGSTETDTFAFMKKNNANNGGLDIYALNDAGNVALSLVGLAVANNSTKGSGGNGAINLRAALKCGTGTQAFSANDNMVYISDYYSGSTKFIFDADGDIHVDGSTSLSGFDDYCDVELLTAAKAVHYPECHDFRKRFSGFIDEYAQVLHDNKIVTMNNDGHHFISYKGMMGLTIDTIRQLHGRIETLETQLTALQGGK